MPLTLFARFAWMHDWTSPPSLNAAFQTLPGASFTVNGAAPATDSALASAGAELQSPPTGRSRANSKPNSHRAPRPTPASALCVRPGEAPKEMSWGLGEAICCEVSFWHIASIPGSTDRALLSKDNRTSREIGKQAPMWRSARSRAVADLPIGAHGGLRHHRGTANE